MLTHIYVFIYVFMYTQGDGQGCPLSLLIFNIFLADIETNLRKRQTGEVVISKKKFWCHSYADDLVIVTKTNRQNN